jgi:hypothetical protein
MNRTIKEATVKRYHYENHDQLRQHLGDFIAAYNFGRRLKTLKGLTPYEAIFSAWQKEPHRFTSDPHQLSPGSNIYTARSRPCQYGARNSRFSSFPTISMLLGRLYDANSDFTSFRICSGTAS